MLDTAQKSKKIRLPAQPELLNLLQTEIQKDAPDMNEVSRLISSDVAISAAVLKTINSPFFGIKSEILSIHHALTLLGLDATIDVVMAVALEEAMSDELAMLPRFWDSARNTANLCAFVANKLKLYEPSQAYTLGLFHDAGIPLMAARYSGYLDVLKQANEHENVLTTDLEDKIYQCTHADMGYILSRAWVLPDIIRQVIREHHDCVPLLTSRDPELETTAKLMAVLKLAEWGSEEFRQGQATEEWARISQTVLDFLYMSEDDSLDLLEEMKEVLIGAQ